MLLCGAMASDVPVEPPVPPPPPGGGESRNAWLLAVAAVLLAAITAGIVFLLATRDATPQNVVATPSLTQTVAPTVSGSPSASATATATAAPTPAPTAAPPLPKTPAQQAAILYPASGSACGHNGNYAGCPVTPQLVDAANQWRTNHNPSSPEPLCRCPVTYSSPQATQDDSLLPPGSQGNPAFAAVTVRLHFDATHYEDMVVLFNRQPDGSWLAYDTYCDDRMNSLGAAGATGCTVHG